MKTAINQIIELLEEEMEVVGYSPPQYGITGHIKCDQKGEEVVCSVHREAGYSWMMDEEQMEVEYDATDKKFVRFPGNINSLEATVPQIEERIRNLDFWEDADRQAGVGVQIEIGSIWTEVEN